MIDSGSIVTIIRAQNLKNILPIDVIFAQPLPQLQKYVDFNQQPLKIAGFIHLHLKVGIE